MRNVLGATNIIHTPERLVYCYQGEENCNGIIEVVSFLIGSDRKIGVKFEVNVKNEAD